MTECLYAPKGWLAKRVYYTGREIELWWKRAMIVRLDLEVAFLKWLTRVKL